MSRCTGQGSIGVTDMQPKLLIRKGMMNIQGRNRPVIQIEAVIAQAMLSVLSEHFINENLFKRSSYASGFPQGVPLPPPSVVPHLGNMLKNDACPEITVKTILAGQTYQANGIWDLMAFEYIAKRAFDNLLDVMACAAELKTETTYLGPNSDVAAFVAEVAADAAPAPAPISPSSPQRLANAA
jgi:hypothetical protein